MPAPFRPKNGDVWSASAAMIASPTVAPFIGASPAAGATGRARFRRRRRRRRGDGVAVGGGVDSVGAGVGRAGRRTAAASARGAAGRAAGGPRRRGGVAGRCGWRRRRGAAGRAGGVPGAERPSPRGRGRAARRRRTGRLRRIEHDQHRADLGEVDRRRHRDALVEADALLDLRERPNRDAAREDAVEARRHQPVADLGVGQVGDELQLERRLAVAVLPDDDAADTGASMMAPAPASLSIRSCTLAA